MVLKSPLKMLNFYYRILDLRICCFRLTDIKATVHGVNDALLLSINEQ